MKRYICVLLALLLALSLVGCGEGGNNGGATESTTTTTTTEATTTTTTTTTAPTTTTTTAKPKTYTYSLFSFDVAYDLAALFNAGNDEFPYDLAVAYGVYHCNYAKYKTYENEYGNVFRYTIPENLVLNNMRQVFAINDTIYAKIKAQATYSLNGPDTATYQDGYFVYEEVDGWGGPSTESKLVSLTDNKDGTMTANCQVLWRDEWQCNYIVVYSYQGTADYTLNKAKAQIQSTNKDFIKSLRVISIQEDLR